MHSSELRLNKRAVSALLLPISLSAFLFSCSKKEHEPKHLNVLFIAVDDLRPELNCYGAKHMKTPNIDRLAEQGIVFERAFCQQAICMASRASIFTGLYPATNQIYSCMSVESLMPGALTINKHFTASGYNVIGIGKLYHHHEDHLEQFGDVWKENQTWRGDQRRGRGYITPEAIAELTDEGRGPAWEIANAEDNEYLDGYTAGKAVELLGNLKNSSEPFFLGVGFTRPHLPFNVPEKYWNLYDHDLIKTTDNPYYPEDGSDYGKHNFGEIRNYTNIPKGSEPIPEETQKMLIHGYRAAVSYTDAQIGKIIDALDNYGLLENTVIVLWGDHGWKLGEHGMWCKHTNFENDTKVPLIIAAPGMKRGVKSSSFAEFVDLFPTLADLCNIDIPQQLHGKSLVPVLTDPKQSVKNCAYSIWPSNRAKRTDKDAVILGYSVRTDSLRYTEWIHVKTGELLDRELYDHIIDPGENKNVISDNRYSKTLPKVEELIDHFRKSYQN